MLGSVDWNRRFAPHSFLFRNAHSNIHSSGIFGEPFLVCRCGICGERSRASTRRDHLGIRDINPALDGAIISAFQSSLRRTKDLPLTDCQLTSFTILSILYLSFARGFDFESHDLLRLKFDASDQQNIVGGLSLLPINYLHWRGRRNNEQGANAVSSHECKNVGPVMRY